MLMITIINADNGNTNDDNVVGDDDNNNVMIITVIMMIIIMIMIFLQKRQYRTKLGWVPITAIEEIQDGGHRAC